MAINQALSNKLLNEIKARRLEKSTISRATRVRALGSGLGPGRV
jgi:hypothetical protein